MQWESKFPHNARIIRNLLDGRPVPSMIILFTFIICMRLTGWILSAHFRKRIPRKPLPLSDNVSNAPWGGAVYFKKCTTHGFRPLSTADSWGPFPMRIGGHSCIQKLPPEANLMASGALH